MFFTNSGSSSKYLVFLPFNPSKMTHAPKNITNELQIAGKKPAPGPPISPGAITPNFKDGIKKNETKNDDQKPH